MERVQVAALIVPSGVSFGVDKPAGVVDPLAPIAGRSIPGWIVDAALGASVRRIALVAHDTNTPTRQELLQRSDDALIEFVPPLRDVADTLSIAVERLGSELTLREAAHILVLPAECPQIDTPQLRGFIDEHVASGAAATVGTSGSMESLVEPVVVRDENGLVASIADVALGGVSLACVKASLLIPALRRGSVAGWERGAPLGDLASVLADAGHHVHHVTLPPSLVAIRSMTSRAVVEQQLRRRVIDHWLSLGVDIPVVGQVAIDATVSLGPGVQLLPGSVLQGDTVVGEGAQIGPNTHLVDATVGCNAIVPSAVVRGSEVGSGEALTPFTVRSAPAS